MNIRDFLEEEAERLGVNPQVAYAIAMQESSLNPSAKNNKSTAAGIYQFIDSTWDNEIKRLRLPYAREDKLDPQKNITVGLHHIRDNIERLGGDPKSPDSLGVGYMSHFLGRGGARRLLNADPSLPPNKVHPKWHSVVKANPFLKNAATVEQAINEITSRVSRHLGDGEARVNTNTISLPETIPEPVAKPPAVLPESYTSNLEGIPEDFQKQIIEQKIRRASNEELEKIDHPLAIEEMEYRKQVEGRSLLENLMDPKYLNRGMDTVGRNILVGFPEAIGDTISQIGTVAAIPELGARAITGNFEGTSPAKALVNAGQAVRQTSQEALGLEEAKNTGERFLRVLGPASIPIMRNNPALAGKGVATLQMLTPFTIGGGTGRTLANIGVQTAGYDILKEIFDGQGYTSWLLPGDANAEPESKPTDEVVPVRTASGKPTNTNARDLSILAGLGGLSLGLAFGPSLVRVFTSGRAAKPPKVRDLDTGVQSMETVGDVLATQLYDATAAAKRIARRAGFDPDTLSDIEKTLDIDTNAAGRARINSALHTGEMNSSVGSWKVSESPVRLQEVFQKLPQATRQQLDQYLKLNDIVDDIVRTGNDKVRGVTFQEAKRAIARIERVMPEVKDFKLKYTEIVHENRRFLAEGRWATISKQDLINLNKESPNRVPYEADPLADKPFHERIAATLGRDQMGVSERIRGNRKASTLEEAVPTVGAVESLMRATSRDLSLRLKNEIKGRYIDGMRQSAYGQKVFRPITAKEFGRQRTRDPNFVNNVVHVYEHGRSKYYVTSRLLRDILTFDPSFMTANVGGLLHSTRKVFETTTTGYLAPWFPPVTAIRNTMLGKASVMPEFYRPTYLATAWAIPQQLGPAAAKGLSDGIYNSLQAGSGGVVTRLLGEQGSKQLADKLSHFYMRSLLHQVNSSGSVNVALTQQQVKLGTSLIDEAMRNVDVPVALRRGLNGWKALLDSVSSSANFGFISRNVKKGYSGKIDNLLREARNFAGDPTKGGMSYVPSGRSGSTRSIGFDPVEPSLLSSAAPRAMGLAAEAGRTAIPWFNPMVQGIARIGQSYWQNPVRFTARVWTTVGIPSAASYFWNAGLGPEYVEHMMERRSDYNRTMKLYIGIPGKPPHEGIEIPLPHELAIVPRMLHAGLDQFFRGMPEEEAMNTAMSWLGTTFMPATPPIMSGVLGTQGISTGGGPFGLSGTYQRRDPAFDQINGLSSSVELTTRAFFGGVADILGAGYAAWDAEEGGVGAAAKEMGHQTLRRAPVIPEMRGMKPIGGFTSMQDTYWKKKDAINDLADFYRVVTRADNQINTQDRSKSGTAILKSMGLGDLGKTISEPLGIVQPEPTNPLYNAFIVKLYEKFGQDKDSGFLSLSARHSDLSKQLQSLRAINHGNLPTWKKRIAENDTLREIYRGIDIDRLTPYQFINVLEKERQDVARMLLYMVKETEKEMTSIAGQEVQIEDLDPYANP